MIEETNNKKKTTKLVDLLPQDQGLRWFVGAVATVCTITAAIEIARRCTAAAVEAL